MLVMVKLTLPVFVRVMVCGKLVVPWVWLAKVRVPVERLATEAVPVPVSVTKWGLPGALSTILIEAERPKMAVGVNVTLMVQLPPFAVRVLPQALVWLKSPALVPVTEMLVIDKLTFPVLVRVTPITELVVLSV